MTFTFAYTPAQFSEMEALAYRIADNNYLLERYGREEARHELDSNRKTLDLIFARLDALRVPFWVQNAVISWADDWRRYKGEYMATALRKRGINAA